MHGLIFFSIKGQPEVAHCQKHGSAMKGSDPYGVLSGSFSIGWAKAGMVILRDPDKEGMVGTIYPSAFPTPKGFGQGTLIQNQTVSFRKSKNQNRYIIKLH